MKKEKKVEIKITIKSDGYCDIEIKDEELTSMIGANTPMQLLGVLFREIIEQDIDLKKKIDNWTIRIDKDHAEIIDELMYEKFTEIAEFATNVKKSLYK